MERGIPAWLTTYVVFACIGLLAPIVIVCVVGVVVSFGGAVYTAAKISREKKALELPVNLVPVPATAE